MTEVNVYIYFLIGELRDKKLVCFWKKKEELLSTWNRGVKIDLPERNYI